MDYLLKKFLPRIEFDSYEDFKANYTVNVPENFNFGFDVVDAWAEEEPEKKALVWCDEEDNEKIFTFTDIKRLSNKAANFFKSLGVKKGSVVMLILRRRWEYWVCATALHKLGAILIPGTLQLTKKDIVYRGNAAQVCAVVCVNDPFVIAQMPKMVSVNSAIEIDITGQVVSDSIGPKIFSGFGGQVDFIYGASRSKGGKAIIAMPSTTKKGESKIVGFLRQGAGVVTTRAHVRYIVTEYGIADLYGKSLRERARAMIDIAHPDHREELEKVAREQLGLRL